MKYMLASLMDDYFLRSPPHPIPGLIFFFRPLQDGSRITFFKEINNNNYLNISNIGWTQTNSLLFLQIYTAEMLVSRTSLFF